MDPKEIAQKGLTLIKEAMLECLKNHPDGLTNAQMADMLDLHSDYLGGWTERLPPLVSPWAPPE